MKPPEPEREAAAGPGAAARVALRIVDTLLGFFQRQHNRLAGPDAHEGRRGRAPETPEPEATAVATRPSLLRRLAIGLLLLLAGLAAGGYLAYRSFSVQLKAHDSVVEGLQGEIEALHKEDARNVKLLDKFQRENAEYRHEAREAQRETESAKGRVAELEQQIEQKQREEQVEQAKRAEQAALQARRATASPRTKSGTPQKTGKCAVGGADDLSNCLEKFNSR